MKVQNGSLKGGVSDTSDVCWYGFNKAKYLPSMQETRVWFLGQEDPLEKGMATHSSILAWRIPWTEKPGRLQSRGSQRVGHDWVTNTLLHSLNVCWYGFRKAKSGQGDSLGDCCHSPDENEANEGLFFCISFDEGLLKWLTLCEHLSPPCLTSFFFLNCVSWGHFSNKLLEPKSLS